MSFPSSNIKTTCSILSFLLVTLTRETSGEDIPLIFMAEEVGYGAKGVMHYLRHLIEGCDNVGDLNQWVEFMESFLSCEEAAWPYQSDEEKDAKTDLQLIEEFCNGWPKRWKCGNQLALKLDSFYEKDVGQSQVGTNALKFSDSYVRQICQNKNEYLDNLAEIPKTHADRRSITCFEENRPKISECVKQRTYGLQRKYGMCKNVQVLQDCYTMTMTALENSCSTKTMVWMTQSLNKIKMDLTC